VAESWVMRFWSLYWELWSDPTVVRFEAAFLLLLPLPYPRMFSVDPPDQ